MSCEAVEPELVAYHFGTLDPATREGVEAHLLACRACLGRFVALKRAVELGAHEAPVPSAASRQRLRAAVLQELGAPPPRRWRAWERPLAFGFAGAAVALAVLCVQALSVTPGQPPRSLPPAAHASPSPP